MEDEGENRLELEAKQKLLLEQEICDTLRGPWGSECLPSSTQGPRAALGIFGRFNPKSIRNYEGLSTEYMESQAGLGWKGS